jgi:uncharacterized protein (TIGR03000 family)
VPEGEAAPIEGSPSASLGQDAVMLNVWVPTDAKVFVNGTATTSQGSERRFVSRGLRRGANYAYEVRAEIVRDGKKVIDTKQIVLTSGQKASLEFAFDATSGEDRVAAKPVSTTLRLNVPADAKVYLAGKETQSTGEEREFTTTRLASGENWNDYTVRVELTRNGQTLSKESTISLIGGQDRDLAIEFDADSVASTR